MKALVIFGSSIQGFNPRDIDVVCEGEFGPDEEALVRRWAAERGLSSDLPLDVKSAYVAHDRVQWEGETTVRLPPALTLPTPRPREEGGDAVILRGPKGLVIEWARSYELPAQIRGARSVDELLEVLRVAPQGARCALFNDGESSRLADQWGAYTQGRAALRNAIAKCPFWDAADLIDPRVSFVERIANEGVPERLHAEVRQGSGAGGGAGECMVTLDGIQPTHGRLILWSEVFV